MNACSVNPCCDGTFDVEKDAAPEKRNWMGRFKGENPPSRRSRLSQIEARRTRRSSADERNDQTSGRDWTFNPVVEKSTNKNNNKKSPSSIPVINCEEPDFEDCSFSKSSLTSSIARMMPGHQQTSAIYRQFGPEASEVIQVEQEDDIPFPAAIDHVVIRVQASTVSLKDCMMRRGFDFSLTDPVPLPIVPGHDIVGRIVTCGTKVGQFKENDRVAALVRTGGNARYISVPESSLVKVPRNLDSAEAAAMVSIYTTAYQALKLVSQQGPMFSLKDKKVLIIGGMDGVGQALIQMCKKAKAEVFATAPDRRHGYVQNILNAKPLPADPKEWLKVVEGTIDIVFDGSCEDGLESPAKALNKGGEIVCFGHLSMLLEKDMGFLGAPLSAHVNKMWAAMLPEAKTLDIWESFQQDPDTFKRNLRAIFELLRWNKLKPHIARRVSLSEVAHAQKKLEKGEVRGTVVCLPWKRVSSKHIVRIGGGRE